MDWAKGEERSGSRGSSDSRSMWRRSGGMRMTTARRDSGADRVGPADGVAGDAVRRGGIEVRGSVEVVHGFN